jgi:hypothetical protein
MTTLQPAAARCRAVAAVVAGLLLSQAAIAQEVPRASRLTAAVRQGWIRFELSSGRVALKVVSRIGPLPGPISDAPRERLAIGRAMGGDATLDYDLATVEQEITIRFTSANRMEIRRVPQGDSKITPVEFDQPATGPVTLKVGAKDVREYRAASLWHLVLAEPAECRQSLVPLLNLLQPNWDLDKSGEEIRAVLLRMAEGASPADHKQWAEWVRQLGDDQFAKREAADQQLREAGRGVVSYLQQLDTTRLDVEQRFRIRRMVNALTTANGDDSPEQVASWLIGDASVWLAMLSSPEESTRKTAARQLGALRGGPITFDPAADAATRKKQIEALRPRIEGKG